MSYFARIARPEVPIRTVLVGAGGMGQTWMRLLQQSPGADLVGVVDVDLDRAQAAAAAAQIDTHVVVGTSLADVAARSAGQAVVNVTVPTAHHTVIAEALALGLPVLTEKPVVSTVAEALDLTARAQLSGQLVMTSQSRRYYRSLTEYRQMIGEIGDIGLLSTEFFTGPRFGGFRDEMEHPLLLDMAIHAFDCCRFLLDATPVSVYCDEFNPSWSWFKGDAASVAVFEMSTSSRFLYSGSWCNEGMPTSWNGRWTARGAYGSATWDGSGPPLVEKSTTASPAMVADKVLSREPAVDGTEEIAGALAEFLQALDTGQSPSGDIHSNIWSLAMVEAAVQSANSGRKVYLEQLLESSYEAALARATASTVGAKLKAWGSARAGLEVKA